MRCDRLAGRGTIPFIRDDNVITLAQAARTGSADIKRIVVAGLSIFGKDWS